MRHSGVQSYDQKPKSEADVFMRGIRWSFPPVSLPKIPSGPDSHSETESSHHWERCLQSCTRSECSSRIYSSRGPGLELRICFSVISSTSLCSRRHLVFDCAEEIWPRLLGMAQVVQPETILRWHRAGFKVIWRWKS